MSISENQLESNRRNAQMSTGPKTISGKAISSRNALKHGCYSHDIVIRCAHIRENPDDFVRLLSAVTDQLRPDNYFEESIVLKIANCIWRSRRVTLAETAHIKEELADIDPQMLKCEALSVWLDRTAKRRHKRRSRRAVQRERHSRAARCLIPDRPYTHHLQLYEMRLDRQLARLYRLYYAIKQTTEPRAPQLAVGMPYENRNATPNTKTTETNPTIPEPQQVTPSVMSTFDRAVAAEEPLSGHALAVMRGLEPFEESENLHPPDR